MNGIDYIITVQANILGKADKPHAGNRDRLHDEWVSRLVKWFREKGYRTIREGKMPMAGWRTPDLFVLHNLTLEKVVEVIVLDPYEDGKNSVALKVKKMKDYYDPPEIVVFEPVDHLDRETLSERADFYKDRMGSRPDSYHTIQKFYADKWKKEHGWNVVFWSEKSLR